MIRLRKSILRSITASISPLRAIAVSAALVAAIALLPASLTSCISQRGGMATHYASSPVVDTLTVSLPDRENEFCEIKIYGNGARMYASDYVINGCVQFDVRSLPPGRHHIFIHAGDLRAEEIFVKR